MWTLHLRPIGSPVVIEFMANWPKKPDFCGLRQRFVKAFVANRVRTLVIVSLFAHIYSVAH